MDDKYHILKHEVEHHRRLTRDLISGIINLQWLVLDLLDREQILSRDKAIAMLEEALNELGPEIAQSPDALPIRHVVRALSGPRDDAPRRGWTPVVLPGGKDASERPDPPEDQ